MGIITADSTSDGYVLFYKLAKNEEVNVRELDIITRGEIQHLLHVGANIKKRRLLVCAADGCMTLEKYLETPLSRGAFFRMISQMLDLVDSCKDKIMHIENIEFKIGRIFVDVETRRLRFIYWPVVNPQAKVDIAPFLKNIVFAATFLHTENTEYVYKYIHYVNNADPFSITAFGRFIREQLGCDIPRMSGDARNGTAYLLRTKTGERVMVDKPFFRIGAHRNSADYVIFDNETISRRHADIVIVGERFYVVDNTSTNGTTLNGAALIPERKTELLSGAELMLSDESFTFIVE